MRRFIPNEDGTHTVEWCVFGQLKRRTLPITAVQVAAYCSGVLAQNAFPHLSVGDREFIISGVTEEEWEALFPPNRDEDEEDVFPPG